MVRFIEFILSLAVAVWLVYLAITQLDGAYRWCTDHPAFAALISVVAIACLAVLGHEAAGANRRRSSKPSERK